MSDAERPKTALTLFFDGACPLCAAEVGWLQRRDHDQRIEWVDIAARDFAAADYGRSQSELMARIHARLPDGTWLEGTDVFRALYAAVGLGWLVAPTAWPGVRPIADAAYRWFARNRLRLTGRPACADGNCALPGESTFAPARFPAASKIAGS